MKNGETYDGHLVNCGTWMNIHLREVICTSKDGQVLASAHDEIGSQLVLAVEGEEVERRLVAGLLKALSLTKRMVVKAWAVAGAGVDLGVKVVAVEGHGYNSLSCCYSQHEQKLMVG
ncbi:hypothetical protein AAC387_Pa11g0145 [Persea americana]